jgi:pyrimidine-specific ribonucleoside hydrolase
MAATWSKKIANVDSAGVLIAGSSAENGGAAAVLLGGRFYTGRRVYEYTDFGGCLEKAEWGQPHLAAFREFAEEYFGLSEVGCVPHGRKACQECRRTAQSLAQQLWDAARDFIVGGVPVVHTGKYASFVVPADAVLPVLQRSGHLPCTAKGDSAIDVLFSAAKQNPELTSLALVSIDELLSAGVSQGIVEPLAVRSLNGMQYPSGKITLRKCMVGRDGASLMALSNRLEEVRQSAASKPKIPCAKRSCLAEVHQTARPATARPNVSCKADRLPIVFDMGTEDPDDVLTLLFLAAHAAVDLKAVTVTPGSLFQVSLVRWLLKEVGLSGVRVGAQDWPKNKNAPAPRGKFYTNFQHLPTKDSDCEKASKVLLECCDKSTTLLTGGPLTNLAAALLHDDFQLGRWVAQGGFAGEGVVPWDRQMDKFKGKAHCRTTNFGSDPHAAHCALRSESIDCRVCVSKNVCHQTLYADGADGWHTAVLAALHRGQGRPIRQRALELMHKAMSSYLARQDGKMIHDPLALAVALDESVCTLAEVELYSHGFKDDQWGCCLCPGSGTWISVDYDEAKFRATLLHDGFVKKEVLPKMEDQHVQKYKEEVEYAADTLSCTEKELLKLAKKLREILKLENHQVAGATLQKNQQEKINGKEDVTAQFLELVELLPADSDIIAKVHDLIPAMQRVTDNHDEAIAEEVPAMVQVTGGKGQVELYDGVHGDCTELQKDVVEVQMTEQSSEAGRRGRQRGGRSGFKRRFDAKHRV